MIYKARPERVGQAEVARVGPGGAGHRSALLRVSGDPRGSPPWPGWRAHRQGPAEPRPLC